MVLSPQASHLSVSLSHCTSGTASKACGRSAKPGPGFGARLLLVEQDPGPLRAEGWERRVEGEGGRAEREESRGSKQYSSGSPSKSSNPSGETGFLYGERGRVWREWEKEGERCGRQETRGESIKRERKEVIWVVTFFRTLPLSFSLPLSVSEACMHLPFRQRAILRWSICVLERGDMRNLARTKASLCLSGASFRGVMCVCVYDCIWMWKGWVEFTFSRPPHHPPEGTPNASLHTDSQMCLQKSKDIADCHLGILFLFMWWMTFKLWTYKPLIERKSVWQFRKPQICSIGVVHVHFLWIWGANSTLHSLCRQECVFLCVHQWQTFILSLGQQFVLASIRGSVFLNASVKGELTCSGTFPSVYYYIQHLSCQSACMCLCMCMSLRVRFVCAWACPYVCIYR